MAKDAPKKETASAPAKSGGCGRLLLILAAILAAFAAGWVVNEAEHRKGDVTTAIQEGAGRVFSWFGGAKNWVEEQRAKTKER